MKKPICEGPAFSKCIRGISDLTATYNISLPTQKFNVITRFTHIPGDIQWARNSIHPFTQNDGGCHGK